VHLLYPQLVQFLHPSLFTNDAVPQPGHKSEESETTMLNLIIGELFGVEFSVGLAIAIGLA
jgi:hypothetical protein